MNKNLDLIAKELYTKLFSYRNLTMLDSEGNDVDSDTPEAARVFNFIFKTKNSPDPLADITIRLNDNNEDKDSIDVLISNDLKNHSYANKKLLEFGKEIRNFAKQHMLTFNIHTVTRSIKEKNIRDETMNESKLFGTAKTSYQRIGEATLIIKHRECVNQESPAGRSQKIESIYVENAQGERFKYPFKYLNGARAIAQHVSNGGNLYDGVGKYITGMNEELTKLRTFKHYVDRNSGITEAMSGINSKVVERISQIKQDMMRLQKPSYYQEFAENFVEPSLTEVPEDIINDWVDRLTIRTFNEELKSIFPYVFNLISEDDLPVKEISVDDLMQESGPNEYEEEPDSSIVSEAEMSYYESYLNRIIEGVDEGIFADENDDAIAELNRLLENPLPLGVDGTNSIKSLEGLGFDDDFIDGLETMAKDEVSSKMDIRPFIKEYVRQQDIELGTNVLEKLNFEEEPAAEMPPAEEPAAEMPPAEEPAAEIPPAEEPAAEIPPAQLPPAQLPPAQLPPAQLPPLAEQMIKEEHKKMFNELKEFISSMYNEDAGNFPKGIEGVKIACEKKFGDRVGPIAAKIVERMSSIGEMKRIKKLSGVEEDITRRDLLKGIAGAVGGIGVAGVANQIGKTQNLDAENVTTVNGEKCFLGRPSLGANLDGKTSSGKYKLVKDDKGNMVYIWKDIRTAGGPARFIKKFIPVDQINKQGVEEGSEEGFSIEDLVMDQYRNGNDVWEIASNLGMSEDEVQDIINDSEQGVEEGTSLSEIGDTAKGQKKLDKVHKRAVDRTIKAADKRDAAGAKKNQQTANRAWERMADKYDESSELAAMLRIAGLR